MREQLNALPRGTVLDGYEIGSVLGSGGFGITYLARDLSLEKQVAIKEFMPSDLAVRQGQSVLPKSVEDREDFSWGLDRFLEEARALARFDHPNVVKVIRFFSAHATAYIVMEYIEGGTVAELFRREGQLSEARLRGLLDGLLSGLEALHAANFLHRDIKPSNIIVRSDGTPVLLDFGSARQSLGVKSRSITAVVTPGYAPIEQYSSRGSQGPWTDIYALGALCYRAITGEVPIDATERVRRDPLVPARSHPQARVGYSPGLLAAVDAAMMVDEDKRPQTIAAWRAMLGGGPVENVSPSPPPKPLASVPGSAGSAAGVARPVAEILSPEPRRFWDRGVLTAILAAGFMILGLVVVVWPSGPDADPANADLPSSAASGSVTAAAALRAAQAGEAIANRRFTECAECPEMVAIPGGAFTLGSPSTEIGRQSDEGPQRQITLRPFAVSRFEITRAEYAAFAMQTGRQDGSNCWTVDSDGEWQRQDRVGWGGPGFDQAGDHPVVCVSWEDAQAYVAWINGKVNGDPYRLLSESEWEYAARAGASTRYWWGDEEIGVCAFANLADQIARARFPEWTGAVACSDGYVFTAPVGFSTRENRFGLADMAGNVWEWTQDCYNVSYDLTPTNGAPNTTGSCSRRVLRGGSWFNLPGGLRSADRLGITSSLRGDVFGFRLARTLFTP